MSPFQENRKIENEILESTYQDFPHEIATLEEGYDLVIKTIDFLYESSKEKNYSLKHLSIFSLFPRMILTMSSFFSLAFRGYYYDAMSLLRGWIEALGLMRYLYRNNEAVDHWLNGHLDVSSISLFYEVWEPEFYRKRDTSKLYGALCDNIHSNIRAVQELLAFNGKSVVTTRLESTYLENEAKNLMNMNLPYMLLYNIHIIFNDYLNDEVKTEQNNYRKKIRNTIIK